MLLGCGGEKQASVTDTDGATTAETQATSDTESTGSTGGQTTEQTTGSETGETSDGPTTDASTKGETEDPTKGTDTDGDESLEQSCQHACGAFGACDPEVDPEACAAGCVETFEKEPKECISAVIDANMCFAMLSCDEMNTDEPPFPCEDEEMLVDAVCDSGEGCAIDVGVGMDLNECTITYECEFDSYAMDCIGETCKCTINKDKVGECASENVCSQIGESDDLELLTACCGFDL